jgi:endonuclease/exonuclease/phosphatase family metal-dependent hydrolase
LNEVLADCDSHVDQPILVIGGDFNLIAGDGDVSMALRAAGFHDAVRLPEHPTTTAHHPRAIDWIFVSGAAGAEGQVHYDIHASDHYPVSATLVTDP